MSCRRVVLTLHDWSCCTRLVLSLSVNYSICGADLVSNCVGWSGDKGVGAVLFYGSNLVAPVTALISLITYKELYST